MNPIRSFFKTLGYLLTFRLNFPRQSVGKVYKMEDGKCFTVFRHVIIKSKPQAPSPAVFKVRFLLAGMTPERNKRFSLIPIPFFIGLPGFRAKYWMLDENDGYFQGLYEWHDSLSARNYSESIAMKFMKRRSVPGSVYFEIVENMQLEDYIRTLETVDKK